MATEAELRAAYLLPVCGPPGGSRDVATIPRRYLMRSSATRRHMPART